MIKNTPPHNDPVNDEMLSKGKSVIKDFNDSEEVYIEPKRMESKLISIRLPMLMIKNLRIIAQKRGNIGYQQIIKSYIAEGLGRDNQEIRHNSQEAVFSVTYTIPSVSYSLNEAFPHQLWRSGDFSTTVIR